MRERTKQIITIIVAMVMWMSLFFMGCSQHDMELGFRSSARNLNENEGAESRSGWGLGSH